MGVAISLWFPVNSAVDLGKECAFTAAKSGFGSIAFDLPSVWPNRSCRDYIKDKREILLRGTIVWP
jgi:hypothetical protein